MIVYTTSNGPKSQTQEFSVDQLRKVYANIKKENRKNAILDKYIDAINEYTSKTHHVLPYFFAPEHFYGNFYFYNNCLHFRAYKIPTATKLFQLISLPLSDSIELEENVFQSLLSLFKQHRSSVIDVIQFYNNYYAHSDKTIFSDFFNWFRIYNNTLVFISPEKIDRLLFYPITEHTWKYFFETILKSPAPPKALARVLFRGVTAELKKAGNEYCIEYKHASPENMYLLHYRTTKNEYESYSLRKDGLYGKTKTLISNPVYAGFPIGRVAPTGLSDSSLKALYDITQGDIELFDRLSLLCANILSPELLTPKLFIIHGLKSELQAFLEVCFIEQLQTLLPQYHKMQDIIKASTMISITSSFFTGNRSILLSNCHHFKDDTKIKLFKKLVTGKKISIKDSMLGQHYVINNMPVICYTNSHKDLVTLQNMYPSIVLDFSKLVPSQDLSSIINNPWIQLLLPLYGLKIAAGTKPKTTVKHIVVPHDVIINNFIHCCCNISEESFTYADALYMAYTEFFQYQYENIPLKRKDFVNQLKKCGKFEYKRPHTSRNAPNKYAFMNIELKSDFKSRIDAMDNSHHRIEEAEFKNFITNLIK